MEELKNTKIRLYIILFFILVTSLFIGKKVYNHLLSLAPSNYNYIKIGQVAPNFTGRSVSIENEESQKVKLSDFQNGNVILFFYPKDNTPFCNMEAKSFRNNYKKLKNLGFEVIGVSSDNIESHKNFIKKFNIPFKLISDTDHKIHKKYGVWQVKYFFGKKYKLTSRITFIIKNGKVTDIYKKITPNKHAEEILEKEKK